jgi:hypothetical protein
MLYLSLRKLPYPPVVWTVYSPGVERSSGAILRNFFQGVIESLSGDAAWLRLIPKDLAASQALTGSTSTRHE